MRCTMRLLYITVMLLWTWLWLALMVPVLIVLALLGLSAGGLVELAIMTMPMREFEDTEEW